MSTESVALVGAFLGMIGTVLSIIIGIFYLKDRHIKLLVDAYDPELKLMKFTIRNQSFRSVPVESVCLQVYGEDKKWDTVNDKPVCDIGLPGVLQAEASTGVFWEFQDMIRIWMSKKFRVVIKTQKGKFIYSKEVMVPNNNYQNANT